MYFGPTSPNLIFLIIRGHCMWEEKQKNKSKCTIITEILSLT